MGGQLNGESEALYQGINDLPIASPHGHCDPAWFSENENFAGPRRDWPMRSLWGQLRCVAVDNRRGGGPVAPYPSGMIAPRC